MECGNGKCCYLQQVRGPEHIVSVYWAACTYYLWATQYFDIKQIYNHILWTQLQDSHLPIRIFLQTKKR